MRKIFTLTRLIILVLALIVAIMGMWLAIRSALVSGLTTTIANLEGQGYQIAHGGLTVSGFPLTMNAQSENVQIRAPQSAVPRLGANLMVKADRVKLSSLTVNPLTWSLDHSGSLRVDTRGAAGERYMFDVTPANLDAALTNSFRGELKRLSFALGAAKLQHLAGTPPVLSDIGGAEGTLTVTSGTGDLTFEAQRLSLDQNVAGLLVRGFGPRIDTLSLQANISDWLTLEQQGYAAWVDGGGTLKSESWAVLWGNLDARGDFDITFVGGKPEGLINIYVKDPENLVRGLADIGWVEPSLLPQARMFIGAIPENEDGRKPVELVLRDGTVKYGFMTLFRY